MPIPERAEPQNSRADARLVEFIIQRRQAQRRRQMIVLGATAVIGLIVLILTGATVLLFNRSPVPSPSATVAAPPPVRSTPAPQAPARAPDLAALPPSSPPARAPDLAALPPSSPPARAPDLAAPPPSSPPARAVEPDQPQPTTAGAPESGVAPSGPAAEPPGDPDPARRTASWLVRTYGRLEAENRALIVAEFYSGERRAFWQRVLADVRQTPER
jgi:hypothetical protein